MTRLVLCACVIAILAGCREATKVDVPAIEQHIRQQEAKWNWAYAARDAGTVATVFADDATLANPGATLVTGARAIRQETKSQVSDPNFRLQFASDQIQVAASADFAYSRGHYTVIRTDPTTSKPSMSKGSYLTVWRMHAGTWQVVEHFITPNAMAARS